MNLQHTTASFRASGGIELFYQRWRPESSRAAVGIVHGVGDHSGRYHNVVQHLTPKSFTVYAFDMRGHGQSPGARIHIDNWNEYREDLEAFLNLLREEESRKPLFLYGHSMGALITLDYLIENTRPLQGAILSGIPLEPGGVKKAHLVAIARLLSRVMPRFSLPLGLNHSALSRDPNVVKAYQTDPLVFGRVTARWGTEILGAIERLKSRPANVRVPVLLIHGGADTLNLPDGTRRLYESMSATDKTLRIYPGGFHESHNDVDYRQVMDDVAQWLEHRL